MPLNLSILFKNEPEVDSATNKHFNKYYLQSNTLDIDFIIRRIYLLPYQMPGNFCHSEKIYILINCTSFSFNLLKVHYELVIIYSTHRSYYSTVIIVSIYNQLNVM